MSEQPVSALEAERAELAAAESRPQTSSGPNGGARPAGAPARPNDSSASAVAESLGTLDMLMDVSLQLTVELGRTRMTVRQVVDLQKGSVVELNRIAGDPVDVFVNDRLIARGEVVVVDDKFGVRVTEIVSNNREGSEN